MSNGRGGRSAPASVVRSGGRRHARLHPGGPVITRWGAPAWLWTVDEARPPPA
jgi:hypothetical protein